MTKASLDKLLRNDRANVVGFSAGLKSLQRLVSFGLIPGCPITILQNTRGNPILLEARGMRIALSRSEAQHIHVLKT